MKLKAVVIFNPFSGKNKTSNLNELIFKNIDSEKFDVQVWPTEKADDLILLTETAIKNKVDVIIAAGGDGTINQIASRIVNTGILLGIIPLGSGNGFARHFKIPINTEKAIQSLALAKPKLIDTVWLNRHCMVNIGGIGFDAHISALFANNKKRGLIGYIKTILNQTNYKSQVYTIYQFDKMIWTGNAFMISIANATQWGNNVKVHAGAMPDDGLFNIVIVKKFSTLSVPILMKNLLEGRLHQNRNSVTFTGTDFVIKRETDGPVHVDGEPIWLGKEINVNIEPLSLNILSNE
jgi:diacylglycerol kinase (ATP)